MYLQKLEVPLIDSQLALLEISTAREPIQKPGTQAVDIPARP
jgi:hypothetical protein